MKIGLFIFEKKLYRDKSGIYYDTVFTDDILRRYTSVVDQLFIIARIQRLDGEKGEILKKFSEITLPNVKIVEIENVLSISGLTYYFKVQKILMKYIQKADIVFVRMPIIWQRFIQKTANKMGKVCIFEVGADAWLTYWYSGKLTGKIFAPYIEYLTRKVVLNSEYTIYVTNKYLQIKYPARGKSISCSNVDMPVNPISVLNDRIEKIKNLNDTIYIGTLGDLSIKSKGQQFIIEALGKMKLEGNTKFIYRLAGTGNPERLRKIAEKNHVSELVIFDGLIRHDKIGEWLKGIDIYVQPSKQDGLPRSLIEAQSYALPAFGAHTGGIPELLDEDYIFYHDSKKSIDDICDILKNFKNDDMIKQAKRNYNLSQKYSKEILDKKRYEFFKYAIMKASTR